MAQKKLTAFAMDTLKEGIHWDALGMANPTSPWPTLWPSSVWWWRN
jgi:hypothetical protein